MATNNEPPKPPDGHATWLDTAMDWLGEFYDEYPRGLELARAELDALRERVKVAEEQRDKLKTVWDQTCKCKGCQARYEAVSGEKYRAYEIADAEERVRVMQEMMTEIAALRAEVERLEESVKTLRELREYDAKALATARDAAMEEAAIVLNTFNSSPQHLGSVHLWCREKCADAIRSLKGTK